jgi:hypothetical protein
MAKAFRAEKIKVYWTTALTIGSDLVFVHPFVAKIAPAIKGGVSSPVHVPQAILHFVDSFPMRLRQKKFVFRRMSRMF